MLLQTSFRFTNPSTDRAFKRGAAYALTLGGSVGYMALWPRFSILSVHSSIFKMLLEILVLGKTDVAGITFSMTDGIEDVLS